MILELNGVSEVQYKDVMMVDDGNSPMYLSDYFCCCRFDSDHCSTGCEFGPSTRAFVVFGEGKYF